MTETAQTAKAVDFGLRNGMTVEVLTMENRLAFVGKVERFQDGAVILRDAKGNDLPHVIYNREMKLRYAKGGDTALLQGKICGSTNQIWKLDRLESKFTKEQRAFFRQSISTRVQGKCYRRSSRDIMAKEGYPCYVLDVSAGGLLFSSEEAYQVGDRVTLTGVRLAESMDPFSFTCRVRRAGPAGQGVTRYGCQFEALSAKEQDRLLRAIFIVQREEIRNQKDKDRL